MPSEPNRGGEPILDVDHVQDLARGGEDHPRNMIALCPNCHAVKTRGANEAQRRRVLGRVAQAAHAAMGL
ncbi:HNH endonuclease [Pseudarthrobacter sulfonivorans]|uniref:HNH endonuclease n=1 Tax=Pseudarthrobacter sulfonivorans TaxID=121292 RepID=UPI0037C628DF